MTRIEIAADQWAEWPDSDGWYVIGVTGEEVFAVQYVTREEASFGVLYAAGHSVNKQRGYRFARVELPIVPTAKDANQCTKQS